MTIRATGEYQLGDLQNGQRLHFRFLRYLHAITYFVIGALILAVIHLAWIGLWMAAIRVVVLGAVGLALHYYSFFVSVRKQQTSPGLEGKIELTLDDEGITIRSLHSQSDSRWEGFLKWKVDKVIILVYPSPNVYFLAPKRFFSDEEEWQAAQLLLSEHIGPAS